MLRRHTCLLVLIWYESVNPTEWECFVLDENFSVSSYLDDLLVYIMMSMDQVPNHLPHLLYLPFHKCLESTYRLVLLVDYHVICFLYVDVDLSCLYHPDYLQHSFWLSFFLHQRLYGRFSLPDLFSCWLPCRPCFVMSIQETLIHYFWHQFFLSLLSHCCVHNRCTQIAEDVPKSASFP